MSDQSSMSSNEQLRALVAEAGLTQAEALKKFNQGLGPRAYSMVTWKAFFASPESNKFRPFKPSLLDRAKKRLENKD